MSVARVAVEITILLLIGIAYSEAYGIRRTAYKAANSPLQTSNYARSDRANHGVQQGGHKAVVAAVDDIEVAHTTDTTLPVSSTVNAVETTKSDSHLSATEPIETIDGSHEAAVAPSTSTHVVEIVAVNTDATPAGQVSTHISLSNGTGKDTIDFEQELDEHATSTSDNLGLTHAIVKEISDELRPVLMHSSHIASPVGTSAPTSEVLSTESIIKVTTVSISLPNDNEPNHNEDDSELNEHKIFTTTTTANDDEVRGNIEETDISKIFRTPVVSSASTSSDTRSSGPGIAEDLTFNARHEEKHVSKEAERHSVSGEKVAEAEHDEIVSSANATETSIESDAVKSDAVKNTQNDEFNNNDKNSKKTDQVHFDEHATSHENTEHISEVHSHGANAQLNFNKNTTENRFKSASEIEHASHKLPRGISSEAYASYNSSYGSTKAKETNKYDSYGNPVNRTLIDYVDSQENVYIIDLRDNDSYETETSDSSSYGSGTKRNAYSSGSYDSNSYGSSSTANNKSRSSVDYGSYGSGSYGSSSKRGSYSSGSYDNDSYGSSSTANNKSRSSIDYGSYGSGSYGSGSKRGSYSSAPYDNESYGSSSNVNNKNSPSFDYGSYDSSSYGSGSEPGSYSSGFYGSASYASSSHRNRNNESRSSAVYGSSSSSSSVSSSVSIDYGKSQVGYNGYNSGKGSYVSNSTSTQGISNASAQVNRSSESAEQSKSLELEKSADQDIGVRSLPRPPPYVITSNGRQGVKTNSFNGHSVYSRGIGA